jgi:uncharacterized protein YlxP (DUF503 family)
MGSAVVGVQIVRLRMEGNRSLKDKRRVIKSLKDRLGNTFNLSVAELEPTEFPELGSIGMASIGSDALVVEQVLARALDLVDESGLAAIIESHVDVVHAGDHAF